MKIYGLGSNGAGQLGIGHLEDVSVPSPLIIPDHVRDNEPVCITAGGNHTLVLFQSGALYVTGSNEDGCAALLPSTEQVTVLTPANVTTKVLNCTATWSASILSLDDGSILSCGSGNSGELGLGSGRTVALTIDTVMHSDEIKEDVVQLEASMSHVVAVLANGTVLGWGNGRNGQLGDPMETVWSPRLLNAPFPVARAACGKEFTMLLSSGRDREVLLLGQQKRDRFSIRDSIPRFLPSWQKVAASWGSIFWLHEKTLGKCGRNDRGQLGPDALPALLDIAAGSEHVLAQTEDGRVIVWGWGEHGNCGQPVDDMKDVKQRFNTLGVSGRVKSIGAGCATSFIVTDET